MDIVNQNAYTNCATSNPIQSYSGGKTTIALNTTGSMYFLCPTSNHCSQGQKLAITVAASSGGATPPSSGSPGSPPPPSSSKASPPPPSGSGANGRLCNLMLGLLLVLGTGFALNYWWAVGFTITIMGLDERQCCCLSCIMVELGL